MVVHQHELLIITFLNCLHFFLKFYKICFDLNSIDKEHLKTKLNVFYFYKKQNKQQQKNDEYLLQISGDDYLNVGQARLLDLSPSLLYLKQKQR